MPELPEVETVRRGLARLVVGRQIEGLEILNPGSFRLQTPDAAGQEAGVGAGKAPQGASVIVGAANILAGARVVAARRRAKLLIIDLDNGWSLVIHLKMTGQIVVRGAEAWGGGHPTDSLIGQLPDRSTRVVFGLDDGGKVFFNDQRKFGWIVLMPTDRVEVMDLIARLGPEPFEPDGLAEFRRRIARHTRTSIKAALLDQTVVAGIGNIYADESLWAARTHPARPVGSVSVRRLGQIFQAARQVMELSIELGGSTDRNYVDAEGRRGAYLDFAQVFRRQGQPCSRCGSLIIKTRVAGRGTHLCPHCQRL